MNGLCVRVSLATTFVKRCIASFVKQSFILYEALIAGVDDTLLVFIWDMAVTYDQKGDAHGLLHEVLKNHTYVAAGQNQIANSN